jgi:putative tricarboxylic transport membrane protein
MKKAQLIFMAVLMGLSLLAGCTAASTPAASAAPAPQVSSSAPAPASSSSGEKAPASPAASWKPSGTVELLVPNSPGGGTDIFARTLEKIIRENKLADVTINVVNKPGGSGAVSFGYMLTKRGAGNIISAASTAFWTTPLSGTTEYSYDVFTPLAIFAMDPLMLMVKSDSAINSVEDLVEYSKANPNKFTFAGSSVISEGGLLTFALKKATGCEYKYVPYEGSGEVLTAMLGGHVDGGWMNVSEAASMLASGDLKPIALATEERMSLYPDIPTFKEKGYNVTISQYRHLMGTPDMPPEAVAFWGDLFEKVYNTPEFAAYLTENALTGYFVGPQKYDAVCREIGEMYAPLVKEALASDAA